MKGSAEPYRSRDKSIREMDKEEDETNLFWGTIKTKNNGTDQWKGGHALVMEVMVDSLAFKDGTRHGSGRFIIAICPISREIFSFILTEHQNMSQNIYRREDIPKGRGCKTCTVDLETSMSLVGEFCHI